MNWSYIAGFFDGEGCISKNGTGHPCGSLSYVAMLPQSESRRIALDKIAEFLDTQKITYGFYKRKGKDRGPNFEQMYNIRVMKRESLMKFLEGVLPYLTVKKILAQDTRRLLLMYPSLRKYGNTKITFKLTPDQIRKMRSDRASGRTFRSLAEEYKVSLTHARYVVQNKYDRKIA